MKKWGRWVLVICVVLCVIYLLVHRGDAAGQPPVQPPLPTEAPGRLNGYTILVDAGHGGYDGGAKGVSGVWEKEINLQMARAVGKALQTEGATVLYTRQDDRAFADKKRADLDARLQMAVDGKVVFLLSIHMNEYHRPEETGPQVFYRKNQETGRLLAGCIQQKMIDMLQPARVRRAMAGDYYMLRLNIPSVLVECGFISNPGEEKLLMDEAYQKKMGAAVCEGVCEYVHLAEKNREQ